MKSHTSAALFGAALALAAPLAAVRAEAQPAISYTVSKEVALGAPDRWDYLHFDPQSGRLYIAHGDRVTVVDGRSGKIIGAVTGMPGGTHGIAISHETGQGFTDDGEAGEVAVFDLRTLKVTKRIKAAVDADGIIYDTASRHIFTINGDSGSLTVIDPRTDRVVATIDTGAPLEFGVSDENGKLYVDGVENHDIVRIDTRTNKVEGHWPMPGCERPHGIAIDRAHARLFSTCANEKMVVLDTRNGAIVAQLPIGTFSDAAVFDAKRQIVLSSDFSGTLSIVRELTAERYEPLPAIKTWLGTRTLALDPETGRIFLAAATMVVDPKADPTDRRHRYRVKPGSVKLYILDPAE